MSISTRRLTRAGGSVALANILLSKLFTSTVPDSTTETGFPISNLTDGSPTTRWISEPTSPATLTADAEGIFTITSARITWAADTIKTYQVQTSIDGNSWSQIASGTTNNTSSQVTDITGLNASMRYFRIVATDRWNVAYGNSIWEVEAYGWQTGTVTTAPQNLHTTSVTLNSVALAWAAPAIVSGTLNGYNIYRDSTKLNGSVVTSTSYTATGLTASTAYTFTVKAVVNGTEASMASLTVTTSADPGAGLIYQDLFPGTTLNSSYWVAQTYPRGMRNNELQAYVPELVIVNNGTLIIRAEKRGDGLWYSGELEEKQVHHTTFGKYQCDMLLPQYQGAWPAFWLLPWGGSGWPNTGEIDIMEAVNAEGIAYQTIHYADSGSNHQSYSLTPYSLNMSQWHTYAVENRSNLITFSIDGAVIGTMTPSNTGGNWPFNSSQFGTILNLAVGGTWPGSPDTTTPNTFELWVRDYRHYA